MIGWKDDELQEEVMEKGPLRNLSKRQIFFKSKKADVNTSCKNDKGYHNHRIYHHLKSKWHMQRMSVGWTAKHRTNRSSDSSEVPWMIEKKKKRGQESEIDFFRVTVLVRFFLLILAVRFTFSSDFPFGAVSKKRPL